MRKILLEYGMLFLAAIIGISVLTYVNYAVYGEQGVVKEILMIMVERLIGG